MRRYRDRKSPTFFRSGEPRRLLMMLFLLVVLGFAMMRASEPDAWQWLAEDRQANGQSPAAVAAEKSPSARSADAARGPTDEEAEEADAAREQFQAISDRAPLAPEEMPAYWRLLKWSDNQTFEQMQRRAQRDILYTQLWEQPEEYRGKLIALRLHVRRAAKWEAPANSAGVTSVYEAWGATDESKSLPYLVVFSELPPGMPLGSNIWGEASFVGYFLKTMAYEAFDKERASPLLVCRLEWHGSRSVAASGQGDTSLFWLTLLIGGAALAVLLGAWLYLGPRASPPSDKRLPDFAQGGDLDDWVDRVKQAAAKENPDGPRHDDVPGDTPPLS